MNQKIDLNKIFEIASSDKSDKGKIEAILEQCSKQTCVEFAYKVCLDIKHLMEDKRSLVAIEALKQYLDTGKPISREIIASASTASSSAAFSASSYASASSAASIASAAAYTSYASWAASYAAYAYAAAIATSCSTSGASSTRLEKDKQYLQLLIELIASSCSCEENRFLHEIMLCTS